MLCSIKSALLWDLQRVEREVDLMETLRKTDESHKKNEKGSAGVIEMSFVLPMAMFVVISLIYLTFSMFLYVHLQGIAEVAADSLEKAVIFDSKGIQFLPFSEPPKLLPETETKIREEYSESLRNLCVLPGMSVNFSFDTRMDGLTPLILVQMECICFKGELFTASVERKVYFPKDFANDLELILDISEDTGAVIYAKEKVEEEKEAYEEFF